MTQPFYASSAINRHGNYRNNKTLLNILREVYDFASLDQKFKEKNIDITNDLKKLKIPILTIGGEYDTMDPKQMEWMSKEVQNGTYLYCPEGSHWSMYDDQENYFNGVTGFINALP